MYHSISDSSQDPYSVSVAGFLEQIDWLAESGFSFVSLESIVSILKKGEHGGLRKKVVVTFDDGYRDFMDNALPILLRYGVPATVFLVTEMLGGSSSWTSVHEPLMSEDEIGYIRSKGISVGSHTATHADLTVLDDEELSLQLCRSRSKMDELGETFYPLSYPWGKTSARVATAAEAAGYECAILSTRRSSLHSIDTYSLPRISIRRDMPLHRFIATMRRQPVESLLRDYLRSLGALFNV